MDAALTPVSMRKTPESAHAASFAERRESSGIRNAIKAVPDAETGSIALFGQEPLRISPEDFRAFVLSAVLSGASDITVQTDRQPRVEIGGVLYRAAKRAWSDPEVDAILTETYGASNGRAEINGRRVLDYSYTLNLQSGEKQRFRINATGIVSPRSASGVEITMRPLPSVTPDLKGAGMDGDEDWDMFPRDGIVIVSGATGQGKSTTLAAVLRHLLETAPRPVKIVDVQAPVEYTYLDVMAARSGSASLIGQSEVGRHVESFADGVHSALRRKPNVICIGEARDFETVAAALEAALTGHLVYTTTHAGSVADTIRRLLAAFPAGERQARAYDLASSLRTVIVQHLIPKKGGGRLPVREYMTFSREDRRKLMSSPSDTWASFVEDRLSTEGPGRRSLAVAAAQLRDRMDENDYRRLAGRPV